MSITIKRRLLKAKMTLHHTIQSILNINRSRKKLRFLSDEQAQPKSDALDSELKVLNKIAAQQARLVQHYESALAAVPGFRQATPKNR
ncbi:MAG: hypothetical protein RL181_2942 [Bacteroidota bacterium]